MSYAKLIVAIYMPLFESIFLYNDLFVKGKTNITIACITV